MAIKKQQLAKGGEIGEVARKKGRLDTAYERFRRQSIYRQVIIIFFVAIGALLIFTAVYVIYGFVTDNLFKEPSKETQYTQEFLKSDDSNKTKSDLVKKYSAQYDQAIKDNSKSDPGNWNKQDLDNAYAALLYANKIGDYNQVNTLIAYIEFAKNQGLNIDDNSYGIDQQVRDAIKQRVDEFNDKAQAVEIKN